MGIKTIVFHSTSFLTFTFNWSFSSNPGAMSCQSQETTKSQALPQHGKQIYLCSRAKLKIRVISLRSVYLATFRTIFKNKREFDDWILDVVIYSMIEMHCSKFQGPKNEENGNLPICTFITFNKWFSDA